MAILFSHSLENLIIPLMTGCKQNGDQSALQHVCHRFRSVAQCASIIRTLYGITRATDYGRENHAIRKDLRRKATSWVERGAAHMATADIPSLVQMHVFRPTRSFETNCRTCRRQLAPKVLLILLISLQFQLPWLCCSSRPKLLATCHIYQR